MFDIGRGGGGVSLRLRLSRQVFEDDAISQEPLAREAKNFRKPFFSGFLENTKNVPYVQQAERNGGRSLNFFAAHWPLLRMLLFRYLWVELL